MSLIISDGSWEERVREAIESGRTTVELSETLFGPDGLFAEVGRTREQREQLLRNPLYGQAHARLNELRRSEISRFEKDIEAFEPRSARITVEIPRSLHAALEAEAVREGVSLSDLVRLKLSFPYIFLTHAIASGPPKNP